jgi:uncharacterized membrane protein YccC
VKLSVSSPSPYLPPALNRIGVEAALRTTVVVMASLAAGWAIWGTGPTLVFASFGACALAFFCDFDGRARERLISYFIATMVSASALLIGAAVSRNYFLAVGTTFVIAFGFAYARLFRGFVARSCVGVQLGFILAVILQPGFHQTVADLWAWLLGCGLATLGAMIVFPRHRAPKVRRALGSWCRSAAALTLALGREEDLSNHIHALRADMTALLELRVGTETWPGSLFPRLRALSAFYFATEGFTDAVARFGDTPLLRDPHLGDLGATTAAAFDRASAVITKQADLADLPMIDVRTELDGDFDRTKEWFAAELQKDPDSAMDELQQHHPLRVMATMADAAQRYALISVNKDVEPPHWGPTLAFTPLRRIKADFAPSSTWFQNGIRAGAGMAVAIGIERFFNLNHGFWFVLTALAMINATFTSEGTKQVAWLASLGTFIGVAAGAALIAIKPPQFVFLIVVPIAIFLAKWASGGSTAWAQGTFSFFSITMFTLIGWPPTIKTAELRFEWVLLGVGLATAVTFLVFPRGHRQLIERRVQEGARVANQMVQAGKDLLTNERRDPGLFSDLYDRTLAVALRFSQVLSAVQQTNRKIDPEAMAFARDEWWFVHALIVADSFNRFFRRGDGTISSPELEQAFEQQDPTVALADLRSLAKRQRATYAKNPQPLITATWATQWLYELDTKRPEATKI